MEKLNIQLIWPPLVVRLAASQSRVRYADYRAFAFVCHVHSFGVIDGLEDFNSQRAGLDSQLQISPPS